MSFKKKVALTILMVVSVLCLVFGAVACSDNGDNGGNGGMSAKDAIARYLLPQNQSLVDADFTLPKTIGSADSPVTVTWTSSNTAAIAIEDKGESYNAKVTIQDQVTDVTLTISAEDASKEFTVRVDGFSVYTFLDNYTFPQRKTAVKKEFDLDTETTFQGKKATISWKIASEYESYIKLNETKNKVLVTPGEDIEDVEIEATFSYNSEKATQAYPFSVAPELEHLQTVNRYYTVADYPLELSGYIVHVYEASESYGNATFYMIDDDFCSGYYCFRVKIDKADVAKYVAGTHVTVSGDTTKNYNGLWENNSGGTAVVDDKAPIDPRDKVYALDTDLLAGTPSTIYHESTFVSLSGWKVVNKADSKPTASGNTIFSLQRGSTKIAVQISKYIQRTDAELKALLDVYDSVEEGEFVNITGILGCYNTEGGFDISKFQIQPILASDITKVDAEGTNTDGAKVKAAIKEVSDKVKANFSTLIAADKEVKMPTTVEGVAISYKVAGAKNPTVTIAADGTFNINPTATEHNYDIQVTYKIGDYTGYSFFKLHNWKATDEEIVKTVKATLESMKAIEAKVIGEYDFPEVDDLGSTITWAVKESSPSWVTVADGKIKVAFLPQKETRVTLVATITLNAAKATAEVSLKVAADPMVDFTPVEEAKAGTYKLAMYSDSKKATYYATGAMNGYYFATSEDYTKAADFVITQIGTDNKYTIKVGGKYLEFAARASGTSGVDILMNDKQTEGKYWQWIDGIKNFVMESTYNKDGDTTATDTDLYYFGNYGTNTTMSGNYIGRIAKAGTDGSYTANDAEGVSQWVAHFGTMETITHRHYYEYTHTDGAWTHSGTCSQPGCDKPSVTANCSPENNVCPQCGYAYSETEILEKLFALTNGQSLPGTYKLTGKVKSIDTAYSSQYGNVTFIITVGGKGIQCFREKSDYSATVKVGDTVTITGALKNDNNTVEFDSGCKIVDLIPGSGTTEPEEPEVGDGTQAKPYNVEQALAIIDELEDKGYYGGDSVKEVYVKGVVVKASSLNSFTIGVSKEAKQTLTIYGAALNTEGTFTKAGDLVAGAEIIVSGALYKYGTTPEVSGKDAIKVKVVSYTDPRTDAEKATTAKDNVLMPKRVDGNFELPAANITGMTFEWAITESSAAKLASDKGAVEVTRGTEDTEVTLTLTVKIGSETRTKTFTIKVKGVLAAGEHETTLDFTSDFATYYAADWTNSYVERVVKMADVSDSGIKGTVTLSSACKQTSTITDRPTMAAQKNKPARITVYADGAPIKSVTFTMKQWTEKKKFCKISIETSADGSEWTVYGTPVGDGKSNTIVITDSGADANNVFTFTATDETVKYVRLTFEAVGTTNMQVGLTSIALKVNTPAPAAAATSVAPVAILPGKED